MGDDGGFARELLFAGISDEKTVFSSYRMFFAYTGSFIVLAFWEPLCNALGGASGKLTYAPDAWQTAMIIVGDVLDPGDFNASKLYDKNFKHEYR